MEHPDFDTLVQYTGGLLPDVARAEFEEHLALPCAACSRRLAELRAVLDTAAADQTAAPPAAVLQQAVAAFDRQPTTAPHPLLRVLAALAFDSRSQLSLAAVRGTSARRQMLFTTQQVDIDLQISPEQGEHRLVGQILGAESAGETTVAFVSLNSASGEALQGTETDAHGQFSFDQIQAGVYDLVFDLAGQEIAITSLEIRDDQG